MIFAQAKLILEFILILLVYSVFPEYFEADEMDLADIYS